ncbi:hypothetical protein [Nocardia sp. NPDC057227]|uniref:hypothetical protein n=1 Tax=Nocardia sp. NPDC057227 TaxID=3346056 RepID=UPI003624C7B4
MNDAAGTFEWAQVLESAEAGELALDPGVASNLDAVCDRYISRLDQMLDTVRVVDKISGFGTFPSATVLEQKFSLKAAGGDHSLEVVLMQHIDAVKLAKQAVAKAIQNFLEQDTASGDHISGTTP